MKHAKVISFEGIDACGKSSQIALLEQYADAQGIKTYTLREPGATDFGEHIRELILEEKYSLTPLTQTLLFAAARTELIAQKITPLLENKNTWIILDRFYHSSLVYQGYAQNMGREYIQQIHQHPELSLLPDITFYLQVSVTTACTRKGIRQERGDYFENQGASFLEKLHQGYEMLLENPPPGNFQKINAEDTPAHIHKKIVEILS